MRYGNFRLKGIQEAAETAPQGYVDLDHLEDDEPESAFSVNPAHAEALARASAYQS